MRKLFKTNQTGSIIVEATMVIPIFLFFCMSFAMLANVVYAQARIQNALVDEARELSQYGYLYSYSENSSTTTALKGIKYLYDQFTYFPASVPDEGEEPVYEFDPDNPDSTDVSDNFYDALDGVYIASPITAMFMIIGMKGPFYNRATAEEQKQTDKTIAKVYFQSHLKSVASNKDIENTIGFDGLFYDDNYKGVKTDKLLNAFGVDNGLNGMDFSGSNIFYTPKKGTTSTPADSDYIEGTARIPDWTKDNYMIAEAEYAYSNLPLTRNTYHFYESRSWRRHPVDGTEIYFNRSIEDYIDSYRPDDDEEKPKATQAFIDDCYAAISSMDFIKESAIEFGIDPADYVLIDTDTSDFDTSGFPIYEHYHMDRVACKLKSTPIMVDVTKSLPATNIKLKVQYVDKPFTYFNLDIKYPVKNEVIAESGTTLDIK
ncbi:MAG: pilus assembly protein [Bifidobacteriaceae bacterium]|jgi:hypothetical protein|nr:pilus assembly protein [Bifidobacteriaceae bacterium]